MPEQGKVKWFSNVKGYGFLEKEGLNQDIFVHYSCIVGEGYKRLNSGEEVAFEIVQGEKGPQAKNVVRIKKPTQKAEGLQEKKEPSPQPSEKPAGKPTPKEKQPDATAAKSSQKPEKSEPSE